MLAPPRVYQNEDGKDEMWVELVILWLDMLTQPQ